MNPPRTIAEYLQQLRAALRGADPALIQDALYDAEEHLRAELAEQPGRSEADMLARVVGSYGAPEEVADIYREQEIKIQRALRPPAPPKRRSVLGRFFGVIADGRTYGALFYCVLALATGVFYFSWAVTGLSLSVGLAVLIVGIPFMVLFFGSVRGLALLEGRIVEVMLGVRMPRRPPYPEHQLPLLKRIGAMFTDPRSWSSLLYMLLMLPLGILYFTLSVTLLSLSLGFISAPALLALQNWGLEGLFVDRQLNVDWGMGAHVPGWGEAIVLCVLGVVLLFATLHLLRGIGYLHGQLAKQLLVRGTAP
jgi:uncharacterized membrane protein